MKKIVVVAFEVDYGEFGAKGMSNSDIIDAYLQGKWYLEGDLEGCQWDIISVNDTVEEKADADETGTTTGTPELDEGPTG